MEKGKGREIRDINPDFNYLSIGLGLHNLSDPPAQNTKLWKNS